MQISPTHYTDPLFATRQTQGQSQTQTQDPGAVTAPAPSAAPAKSRPAHRPQPNQAVMNLISLLNMARPETNPAGSIGDSLVLPGMSLALKSPSGGGEAVSQEPHHYASEHAFALTVEDRAKAIIDQIGGGDELDLAEAQAMLVFDSDTHQSNKAETVGRYFNRVDRDGSGALDLNELKELITIWDRESAKNLPEAPRLPDTWA